MALKRSKEYNGGDFYIHWLSNENGLCVGYGDEVGALYIVDGKLLDFATADDSLWVENKDNISNYLFFWDIDNKDEFDEELLKEWGFIDVEIDEIKEWISKSLQKDYDWRI